MKEKFLLNSIVVGKLALECVTIGLAAISIAMSVPRATKIVAGSKMLMKIF